MINLKFLDGNSKEFEEGVLVVEVAKSISSSLAKKCVGAYVDEELFDLNRPISKSGQIKLITTDDKEAFEILNHSAAHLLAHAILNLYPHAKFGIGPSIEEGFYYDIDIDKDVITEDMLPKIEKEMKRITSQSIAMTREELSRSDALELFKNDEYKCELINDLPDSEIISIYKQGEFVDLCRGGHIGFVKNIKHFKLLSVAGAYWRGNSNNKMLQRIYGTAWFTNEDLEEYLKIIQLRKERDHRKLGRELKIFNISPEVGSGLALWLPNGFKVKKVLEDYAYKKELEAGYLHVTTPVIASKKLYEISGHTNHYLDNMFPIMERDNEEFILRPMLCPHHMMVYKSEMRSYRDLPLRLAEAGGMYRYEASGALIGLERVRSMHLTDSHIFVTPDQMKSEIEAAFKLITSAIADLKLNVEYIELALHDPSNKEKYHPDAKLWQESETLLRDVLNDMQIEYKEEIGEAAFYGPKIDFQIKTLLGHRITLSTIQLDFLMASKFELEYIDRDGSKKAPIVIHRGFISTFERLISVLLEQYNGAFPTWLAPNQIDIIPVSKEVHGEFCDTLNRRFKDCGFRVKVDDRDEKLGYKIRESQMSKVPFQLVVGDREVESNCVTYREYGSEDKVEVSIDKFIDFVNAKILSKE